ncbi:right-handed parallel beta-helix repeat-containing protein [Mariniblastus fucicola]|uniref:right-handed parallel beta-helix repeat-containing protein n=1 Tax=Mariniblastus fucicola TaxID=980251 RepID=UPI0012FB8C74|nr:right-handed parallel beta-helix repeat-containing protein [Mariniblastus fucicola]
MYEPGSFRQVASDINVGLPGRMWFRTTYADQGLGYQGAYLTVGGKRHLMEDRWDGRWLGEARVHYGLEEGGFFANVGVERVFSLESAGADLVGGVWYDYDGDKQGPYAHNFSQVSINAAIKTKKWDLIGNGYFPVGVTDYSTAGPSGTNVFFGSNILLTPGIDSALRGFDVTLRMRPKYLAFGNGVVDFGGYGYSSDSVDFFGGGRARLGFQAKSGMMIMAEVNHDERFETTGSLGLSWAFGAPGAAGSTGRGIGNDLDETVRGDHIVRFNQSFELAMDPATGQAYNVRHVNNTADPAFEDGTYESPYASLASAEAASIEGDIIFVDRGDGSRQGLNTGLVMKDRQQLLGVGGTNIIPIQDGRFFLIPGEGARPVISNPGGTNVVTLANDTTVRGVNIDGSGALNGIHGDNISNGTIEDVNVFSSGQHGLSLDMVGGDWDIKRASFSNNVVDGIYVRNTTDNSSVFTIENVVADGNGFDGIHFDNYRGSQLRLFNNTTSTNGRHGVYIKDYVGAGLDLDIITHTALDNGGTGVFIDGGDGDLNIVNSTISGNGVNGLHILNWSNSIDGDSTFIGNTTGGSTTLGGNQSTNLVVEINDPGKTQDVLVTGISIVGGGRGVYGSAAGIGTELNMSIVDNGEFSQHLTDGLRFEAKNSGTLNVLVENEAFPLLLNDNAQSTGAGIAFFADGPLGQPVSKLNAVVRNVSINNDGEVGFTTTVIGPFGPDGVSVDGTGTSRINLVMEDSRIESAGGIAVDIDNDGNGDVNNIFFDNLVIRSDIGVSLISDGGSFVDFALLNSDIQSNGNIRPIAQGGSEDDAQEGGDPFADFVGDFGFVALVTGDAGGGLDNLTRIQFSNNFIRDFTFDAVSIEAAGDAQLLAYINSNQILRNGPGVDNEVEFPDDPATNGTDFLTVAEDQLDFHDGIDILAGGNSQISFRMNANDLVNNYELGLNLNTIDSGTINGSINFNNFANDIGQDADATAVNVSTSFIEDLSANNFLNGTMCLDLSSNSFRSLATFNQFSTNPFRVELDGATNGSEVLTGPGVVTNSVGVCEGLISDEELFFTAAGFIDADTPPGGGFAPLDHD